MPRDQELSPSAEKRISDFLSRQKSDTNAFMAESAGVVSGPPLPDVGEEDIDEYLLKRAEADLRRARARVDFLKQEFDVELIIAPRDENCETRLSLGNGTKR